MQNSKMAKQLIDGNTAVAEGAMAAGIGFYSGYPITPSSEIMQYLSGRDIVFINAEDEIAAISMIIGASLAGKKAMTATSGPGFSLMQEGLGLAHMMRVPLVVVDSQRVGPSTGMPTLAAQGDILQAFHGSHGDYVSVAFAPNSVEECYKYTIEAFNFSEEARCPAIVLIDGFLSHLFESAELEKIKYSLKPRETAQLGAGKRHFTGLLSKDGVPVTKDTDYYRQWYKNFKAEILSAASRYEFYEYMPNKDSDTLLVAFGTASRVISPLAQRFSIFRPIRLLPVPEKLKEIAKNYRKIIVVEMNDGQYASLLKAELQQDIKSVPVLGGRIILSEIETEIEKL